MAITLTIYIDRPCSGKSVLRQFLGWALRLDHARKPSATATILADCRIISFLKLIEFRQKKHFFKEINFLWLLIKICFYSSLYISAWIFKSIQTFHFHFTWYYFTFIRYKNPFAEILFFLVLLNVLLLTHHIMYIRITYSIMYIRITYSIMYIRIMYRVCSKDGNYNIFFY